MWRLSSGIKLTTTATWILAAALALAACSGAPPPVAVVPVVLVQAPELLTGEAAEVFPGTVRSREEADLAFRVAGKILQRRVSAGAHVKAGEALATVDPVDVRLNLQAAEAAAAAAHADLSLADAELKRAQELFNKGFISKSAYDIRESGQHVARARYEQAVSNVKLADNQARYATLVADKAGLITAVLAEAGQVVAAGQPVLRFAADLSREVSINVPEGRVEALRAAPRLGVVLWARPGKSYQGHVREINLQADRATRTHEARVTIVDADDAIQLGMTATVMMGARMEGGVFQVPLAALGEVAGVPAVWSVGKDQRAHPVTVKVVRYVENAAIVRGALDPSMKIVSAGVHLLVDGEAVRPLERSKAVRPS